MIISFNLKNYIFKIKITPYIFTMNKAFSLFETILVLILIGFLALFLSRTLWEFYYLNNQQLKMKDLILKTHLSVLRLEKLLQTCTNITFEPNHISYLLKDDLLYLDDNKEKLLNSSLILENNTSLYSPNSNFKLQLQNRKELYNDEQNIIYALVNKEIKKYSFIQKIISLLLLRVNLSLSKLE